jgi:hypothetical protein
MSKPPILQYSSSHLGEEGLAVYLSKPYHPPRSKLLGAVNSLSRTFLKNGSLLVQLDAVRLLEKACKMTGLYDFGDDSFLQPLGILVRSFGDDAELNFVGRVTARADILRTLCNRLRLVEDRKRNPGIADEIIRRPLFITGLPRTGSTLLHGLLAQDPACRAPQIWEVMHPSPPPEASSYGVDPRIAVTGRELKWLDLLMPKFKTAHMIDARLPQECIAITGHSFVSYVFESMFFVSSYRIWHEDQDKVPAYEFHRQFLQHLQWRCPGSHWVLKAPSHLMSLEALFQVYPDAGVILTHRDPVKVLASCASFAEVLREPFTDFFDRKELGTEVRERWGKGARLAIEFRENHSDLKARFFDVLYADLVRDPMAMVRLIYRYFDMELTNPAESAMLRFLKQNPQNKHGVHHYTLEDFGFDRETERRRFEFYSDYFGIGLENR